MKIALVTDTHAGVRGDSDTFADYQEKFWYDVFFPSLEEHGIKQIVHLGDITDRRKWISYKTLDRFRGVIDHMRHGYDLSVIIGNHDTYYKNTNRINSMDCLFDSDIEIYHEATEVSFGGLEILFVPWINAGNHEDTMKKIKNSTSTVCFGHLNLAGFPMARGLLNTEGMDRKVFRQFDMVFSGHFHTRSHLDNIWYLGSPYEQTWIDYGDKRGFHIFDTETLDLEFIQNPHKMFEKVYFDAETSDEYINGNIDFAQYQKKAIKLITNNIPDQYMYEKFIEELEAQEPWHLQIIDNTEASNHDIEVDHIESKGTIEILNEYIEQTEYDNKESVRELVKSLHDEAISI